jgi:putative membrane protein
MKIISGVLIAAVTMMCCFTACSKNDPVKTDAPNGTDEEFVVQAAYTNRAAINLGELAMFKSSNDSVKTLAQNLISGHTTAMNKLNTATAQYSYQLPTGMDTAHQALRLQLLSLSGRSFDSAYIYSQVSDLERAVNLFNYEKRVGNAPPIKSYAENTLPALRLHLQMVNSVINDL